MIELTEAPIDTGHVLSLVHDPECGAEVMFVGTTRQWTAKPIAEMPPGSPPVRLETSHLVYEAYREMAVTQMEKLEAEARNRWPVHQVAMVHRLGHVAACEASVAIAVSSPHRGEAFEAAQWLIDELKHRIPIWKQEHYVQHGSEWIHPTAGNCQCTAPVRCDTELTQPELTQPEQGQPGQGQPGQGQPGQGQPEASRP